MSVDAVAILHIVRLAPSMTPWGIPHPVRHRGDASLVNLMTRFDAGRVDEHALALRALLGDALDAHDDPRGILFVPDTANLDAAGYDALMALHGQGGAWTPPVQMDHVPRRFAPGEPGSHDALVGEMIAAMGRDAAQDAEMQAELGLINSTAHPGDPRAAEGLRDAIAAIASRLGADFAARYEASLQARFAAEMARSFPPPPLSFD